MSVQERMKNRISFIPGRLSEESTITATAPLLSPVWSVLFQIVFRSLHFAQGIERRL